MPCIVPDTLNRLSISKALDVVPMLTDDVMARIEEALVGYPDDLKVN